MNLENLNDDELVALVNNEHMDANARQNGMAELLDRGHQADDVLDLV